MTDWRKYPLVRLFIPFLLGIVAGYLCTVEWGWAVRGKWVFGLMVAGVGGLVVCHNVISRNLAVGGCTQKGWNSLFAVLVCVVCFLAGWGLSARRHQEALSLYGSSYKYEMYRQNRFQNQQALRWQQALHRRFAAERDARWAGHEDEHAVVEAITIGWRGGLTREVRQTFARAGISHILALSGYHVSLLLLLLLLLPRYGCRSMAWRRAWHGVVLLILWLYAFTTGMSPSIVRAVLMCSLITICKMLQRDVKLINSCTLAAFIMLAADPLLVGHIGFQLSFCCIAGIALTEPWLPRNYILSGTMLSAVCTWVSFPLVAYHFASVPLLGLVGNFFATFLVPVTMLLAGVWWLVTQVCSLSEQLGFMADAVTLPLQWATWALIGVARTVSAPWFATITYQPSIPEVLCWYGAFLAAISLCHKMTGRRLTVLLLMLTGVLLAAIARKTALPLVFLKE